MLWMLRQEVIPRHFAIVPDGNRRFSRKNGLKLSHAYSILLQKLTLMCHCLAAVGVAEVTGYLLSTRNLTRDATDIAAVLDEAAKFFVKTLHSLGILRRINLHARSVGNLKLLPKPIQESLAQIEIATDDRSRTRTLRLCIAYSSKHDLKIMALDFAKAVGMGVIKSDDINPGLIADWLELTEIPETELWFRSSGERRFSEFLVLQSGYSYMHIEPELWPAMKFSNLI
ncbi:dehydrodolichyl diphosphate synthase complex subunit DHDDS-like [Dermacentor albipictus]|uniref:dehydrodolichyl diphosphate synthase complex subunit DHDDS-like n=1 Tax=Dermacentor albipictus TaxID=60249 RepID=UPI0038FCC471